MDNVAIFIPTFNRSQQLARVIENVEENTPEPHTVYFICEIEDLQSIKEATGLGQRVILNEGKPCYADCINTAYRNTSHPYFFTGADDLCFTPGWLTHALSCMNDEIQVVGTNDLGTIPIGLDRDATHYLVARRYIETHSGVIDVPRTVLFPYQHNYTDKEFIETARKRGVYAYCPESITEHLHWAWGKSTMDDTYRKGLRSNSQDQALFISRQHLWNE